MRIILTISIIILCCFFECHLYSQKAYNLAYSSSSISEIDMLYELDSVYIAFGYRTGKSLGIQSLQINKKTGDILRANYYERLDDWLPITGQPPIYRIGDKLIFSVAGTSVIYKLSYDILSNQLTPIDSVTNLIPGGYFMEDMLLRGDTTIYHATITQDKSVNVSTIIYRYPDGTLRHIYLPNGPLGNYTGGKIFTRPNGNILVFGVLVKQLLIKEQVSITEIDLEGNIVSEFLLPLTDKVWAVDDVLFEDDTNIYFLAKADGYDYIWKERASYHWLYKFNKVENKVLWRKKFNLPDAILFTYGGKIVKGHRPNEYLYCTSAAGPDASRDSFYTVGRIVKIDENGNKLWQRDYTYYTHHQSENSPVTGIATSDGNYLWGGYSRNNSWLFKTDEEGELVIIDTTSSTESSYVAVTLGISIYPNPVSDHLYLSQGDITDVTYVLYDVQGRRLDSMTLVTRDHSAIWDVSHLSAGIYEVVMSRQGKVIGHRKIIKR